MPLLNIVCPICTETFQNADDVYSTSCGHLFHFACLNDWQRRGTSCPQCRHHNPTSHKIYLSFDDTPENTEELEEIRLQLKSSNEKITEVTIQKNEAESNFMQLQQQFTLTENEKRDMEIRISETNDFENHFLNLQAQYTETSELVKDLEDRVQQMFIENECKSKELKLKKLEIDSLKTGLEAGQNSLSDSILNEKIRTLENKLSHISKEFEKEINTSTKLSIEKMKLESYIKHLSSMEQTEQPKQLPEQLHKKSNSGQNGKKTNARNNDPINNTNSNKSIFIRDLPLQLVTLPLENIIVNLAAKMKVTITKDDLMKVNFNKNETNDYSKTPQLVAEFKTSELKTKFLSSKQMLKTNPETNQINIFNESISNANYSLLMYAKEKLFNNGFNNVFHKSGKIFAKKFKAHHKTVYIPNKAQVDKLYEENKRASAPEELNNENNVDENLYQL